MARPQKLESERKSVDLRIPVTSEQKDAITEAIRILGVDMAAWARPILLREAQAILGKGDGDRIPENKTVCSVVPTKFYGAGNVAGNEPPTDSLP